MEALKKKTSRFLWGSLIGLILLCIGVFVWITTFMLRESENTITQVVNLYMEEMNSQLQRHFSSLIGMRLFQVEGITEIVPPDGADTFDAELAERLESAGRKRDFVYMALYNTEGEEFLIRLLVAEDNDINWEIANELLSARGFELEWAENGRQCVDMFMENEPGYYKAILMDLRMPVMDGYEAAKAIRNLEERPDGKEIPVIAMTADAFAEDVSRCLEYGMNAHVAKPLDIDELVRTIKRLL